MTIGKDEVMKLMNQFPEQVDVEELIYRLYLLEKLKAAEEDIAAGRTLPPGEVRVQAASWRR
jgi:hypothetical protein